MKRVYVAGPMNADSILAMLENISKGIRLGGEVLKLGFAPFVPHFDILFRIQQGEDFDVPMRTYYDYTMEFLKTCDCVLVCPGWENSVGTKAEIAEAKQNGIPVFYDLESLKEYYKIHDK